MVSCIYAPSNTIYRRCRYRDFDIYHHSICIVNYTISFCHNFHYYNYSVHRHSKHSRVTSTYMTPKPNNFLSLYHSLQSRSVHHWRWNNGVKVIATNGAYPRLFLTRTFFLCSATFHIYQLMFMFVTSSILQQ